MESSVLGYGSSCAYGHHSCSWGGKSIDKYLCFYNEYVNLRAFDCVESGSEKAISFQGKDIDYHDFVGILALLIINSTISFIEENNAGNAAAALMARLAPKAKVCLLAYLFLKNLLSSCSPIISFFHLPQPGKFVFFIHRSNCFHQVLRDGKWSEEDASVLVPGDIISIKLGDIIPADARLLEGDPLKIDQVPHHARLRNNCFKMLLISVKTHILTVPIFSIL